MSLLVEQLSFGWSSDAPLFENISFAIDRERVALVGPNGVGKSTLIKLLIGELTPTHGRVKTNQTPHYIPQLFDTSLSIAATLGVEVKLAALDRLDLGLGREEDYLAIGDDWDIEQRARDALAALSVPNRTWQTPLSSLSGGQAMRVYLARAKLEAPEVLILDEPTNDLDAAGLERLYRLVETWPSTLLIVSHDRTLLKKIDRILELTSSGLKSYGGAYEFYKTVKANEQEVAAKRYADAEKQLHTTRRVAQEQRERADRREAHGKRTKTGSMPKIVLSSMKNSAQATAGRIQALGDSKIEGAQADLTSARQTLEERESFTFDVPSTGLSTGKSVLNIKDLTYQHEVGAVPILNNFNLKLIGPARVSITGANGTGKSSLLKVISGLLPIESGTVSLGVERHAFLSQRAWTEAPDSLLIDTFRLHNPEQSDNQARAALARFGFRNIAAECSMQNLSGGERMRASLAMAMMSARPPQLLMLDEPTNHMDLESIETLERALLSYDGAFIVVSHDHYFLSAIKIDHEIEL